MHQLAKPAALALAGFAMIAPLAAQEADDPELIFKKTTVWRMLSPDAKLATYALDDPLVEGIACHFTVPEVGGWSGWAGFAEERSETSLSCKQTGPISFKGKFAQGDDVYRMRRSLFFKKFHISRGCDAKRNVLVYLSYTDKLIEGSPQNSTTTVAITPWGSLPAPKCGDFLEK
ncbi:CreA family protein [Nordella sp. HKS 07]|uniref:CreA family protein n=1 Tax=Nordella sp. HKS 07 TaxID=2712222 RepID=UPI0013E1F88C|nr:CreA family protein [Nordella sp. HKS 07]